MFSRFFINRPIFSTVIALVTMIAGAVALPILPIEQFPPIAPPTVEVTAIYPGASASVLQDTVAVPIEDEVNGVEDMLYMSSNCSSDGTMNLTVTFAVGTDIDMATVLVDNRVSLALAKLPEEVKRQGVEVKKKSTSMTLAVNLTSTNPRHDSLFLSNYAALYVEDVLTRVDGVGEIVNFGAAEFGMRIWIDPEQVASRQLTTGEVLDAIQQQNIQVAAGQVGRTPAPLGTDFQYTINTLGRLETVEQFENIILKTTDDGAIVRVRDVARVELGAQNYDLYADLNSDPTCTLIVYQLPGANAISIADGIRAEMEGLAANFPQGVSHEVVYDTTLFVRTSIKEVVVTLFIAVILVIFSVYIFLQDFRTTLIPCVTIPVSLIGTLAVMLALGFSINTLSLFGLVLVIGIVVDDAIVVVENVMRLIDEEGMDRKAAAIKSMEEVTGPVVATTLVLLAVFIPSSLMPGVTGQLYRQFALTIAIATIFSSINALTLSPALCAILLRPSPEKRALPFRVFNNFFDRTTNGYMSIVNRSIRHVGIPLLCYAGLLVGTYFGFAKLPTGFIPEEDQGFLFCNVQLPDSGSLERTRAVNTRIEEILAETEGVAHYITIGGFSILSGANSPNSAFVIIILDEWDDRPDEDLHADAITAKLNQQFSQIQEGIVFAFGPPAIQGLGNAGGFEYQLQDRGTNGPFVLQEFADDLVGAGRQEPGLIRMNTTFRASVPQLFADIDRVKAQRLGISMEEINTTLQANLGSQYVNDFNTFGKAYQVIVQADKNFRNKIEDIQNLKVRDRKGNMIPLSTLVQIQETVGPEVITRYNKYPSAQITGAPAQGFSSGQSVATMERLSGNLLPPSMGFEWTGMVYQEILAGNLTPLIFTLSIVLVFLVLAAQYESWSAPLAIILSVPMAAFGAVTFVFLRSFDINIYTQIGLVLLIGLASKSAILIVEFAMQNREEKGMGIVEATAEAAKLRFRPILMTALSFLLGVIPLVVASGAGAVSRQALGTAVFGGMLAATIFAVLLVPVLYVVIVEVSGSLGRLVGRSSGTENPAGAKKAAPEG